MHAARPWPAHGSDRYCRRRGRGAGLRGLHCWAARRPASGTASGGGRRAGPWRTCGAAAALQDGGEGAARRRLYRTAARERRGGGPAGRRRARLARLARHRAPFASGRPASPDAVRRSLPAARRPPYLTPFAPLLLRAASRGALAARHPLRPHARRWLRPPALRRLCPPASHHGRLLRPLACRRLRPPQPRSPELGRRGAPAARRWCGGRGGEGVWPMGEGAW